MAGETWERPEVVAAKQAAEARAEARKRVPLSEYAVTWIAHRTNSRGEPLARRTVDEYERMLRAPGTKHTDDPGGPLGPLVNEPLIGITEEVVREWHAELIASGTKTQASRSYDLLKSIMKTAVNDGIIDRNPCQVTGGSTTSTGQEVIPPTDAQLQRLLEVIDQRYAALVALGADGGLNWAEATELRAHDVQVELDEVGTVDAVRIRIERQVIYTKKDGHDVAGVKALARKRTVSIFGGGAGLIAKQVAGKSGDDLLFTNTAGTTWLSQSAFWRHWNKARIAAGCPHTTFHALRHYAGTRYAQSGATPKETMQRLGHASMKAAMRYQHAGNRDEELARRVAR
ncbi:tyrosine-type recombinase/integrase [Leucobacter sp. HY1908]